MTELAYAAVAVVLGLACLINAVMTAVQRRRSEQIERTNADLQQELRETRQHAQRARARQQDARNLLRKEKQRSLELTAQLSAVQDACGERLRATLMALDTRLAQVDLGATDYDRLLGTKREAVQQILHTMIQHRLDQDIVETARELASAESHNQRDERSALIRRRVQSHLHAVRAPEPAE